ncbi:MAG TPA: AI-2E family transporter [Phycisphaerales bacterium]|nr:AI-2E family transporter [Phycisphaerales bacterium]
MSFYRGARTLEQPANGKPILILPAAPITTPTLTTVATIVGVVILLYAAKELLIPLALAAFIAMLLQPLVERLKKLRFSHGASVLIVSTLALIPVVAIGWLVFRQFMNVITTLPQHTDNMRAKLAEVQGPAGGVFERFGEMLKRLQQGNAPDEPSGDPLPVTVVEPPEGALTTLQEYAGPILEPIAMIGITLVFAVFILFQWDDLRDRFIRLVSRGRLTTTTAALDELSARIGKFLRMQFIINTMNGACIGLGLYLLDVPNALLWGFLAAVLRYIPYVGAITAALLPIALTIATAPGWTQPLHVVLFLVVYEIISNNFIEPFMYGASTGISAMALLLAAIFWGWLWGIPGMLLATPLTTCLVVAGRHVPQLSFLAVMLGDQPVLEPAAKYYQRLIAMDGEEASEVALQYIEGHSLTELYDDVLLPALKSADTELEDEKLDRAHYDFILKVTAEVVEDAALKYSQLELAREAEAPTLPAPDPQKPPTPRLPRLSSPIERLRVLSIPARDEADAIAGCMLEKLAHSVGVSVRALDIDDLGTDLSAIVAEHQPDYILVSSVPPHASTHARARAKIARRRAADYRYIGAVWGVTAESTLRSRLEASGFEAIVGSMAEAVQYLSEAAPKVMPEAGAVDRGDEQNRGPGRASA